MGTIQLSDKFNYKKLLRFTFPSMIMMVFTSLYMVVDGFFVSNFVGKVPFAGVNFIMPVVIILASIGFMFGWGGSALVSKILGEGDQDKARRLFSLIVYSTIICGIIIFIVSFIFIEPIVSFMGADGLAVILFLYLCAVNLFCCGCFAFVSYKSMAIRNLS